MIKFKTLSWSNAFSYGADNTIKLDDCSLTQLVGKNGNGKSSIALILEEVLFNTNSKKIKKSDILNRYTESKNYVIRVTFDSTASYEVVTTRTATTSSVKLIRDGVDISSHTATGTYKQIEQILGFDHKTFSQIVYQSSISSLEFLTATDTARKKFLIELLNLGIYSKAADVFKESASAISRKLEVSQAKAAQVGSWLNKYRDTDLELRELEIEPEQNTAEKERLLTLEVSLTNIERNNKEITQNNTYKDILDKIVVPPVVTTAGQLSDIKVAEMTVELNSLVKRLAEGKTLQGTKPMSNCKTCDQTIDNSTRFGMFTKFEAEKPSIETRIAVIKETLSVQESLKEEYIKYKTQVAQYEKYTSLYNSSLPTIIQDEKDILEHIKLITLKTKALNAAIKLVQSNNKVTEAHNAKVLVIKEQLQEMQVELNKSIKESGELSKELAVLQVLVKAFSTSGLVAYKIECLVKDLESLTNEYLGVLADGRFQLSFKIASSDKLNVIITDNGRDVEIVALSSGERARVNVATLLAIRKLMQSLSNSRTNLLILDETVENLDAEGKEKLIEVLLEEESLNTFLISHGFTHPLLEKLNIVKEHNISRIES